MRTGARAQPSDEAEGISPCNASDRHRLALAVQYSPWEAAHLASLACFQLHAAVCLMARLPPQAAGFFHARAKWSGLAWFRLDISEPIRLEPIALEKGQTSTGKRCAVHLAQQLDPASGCRSRGTGPCRSRIARSGLYPRSRSMDLPGCNFGRALQANPCRRRGRGQIRKP